MNRGIIKNKWSSIALKSKAVLRPSVRQMAWKCKTREVTKHCSITKYLYCQNTAWKEQQVKSLQLYNMPSAIRMSVNYSNFQFFFLKYQAMTLLHPDTKAVAALPDLTKGLVWIWTKAVSSIIHFQTFFTKFPNVTITGACPKPITLTVQTVTIRWPLCHICM